MRALLLLLLLAGCGSGDNVVQSAASDNHGYGFQYDAQGASGLKLRFSAMSPSDPIFQMASSPAFYEDEFTQTKNCTGLTASPPFVILDNLDVLGRYFSAPSLIVVDVTSPTTVKHEMVHYLLDVNTGNPDPNHVSPLFAHCV